LTSKSIGEQYLSSIKKENFLELILFRKFSLSFLAPVEIRG